MVLGFLLPVILGLGIVRPSGADAATRPGGGEAGFDIDRLDTTATDLFEPFQVDETYWLKEVYDAGFVTDETWLVVTEISAGRIALIQDQMAEHHTAQGRIGDEDWMVTFCVICNSGVSVNPTLAGRTLHFAAAGIYDGLLVLRDKETGSLWNHITGEAVYGPMVGRALTTANLLQMNVRQALEMDSRMRIAVSHRAYTTNGLRTPDYPAPFLSAKFENNLSAEDRRMHRMDMGLGVWSEQSRRYYPIDTIREQGKLLIDELDGRKILVYIDPASATPAAIFVETSGAIWQDGMIHLDDGMTVRSGVLRDSPGQEVTVERPMQIFTRWYGFSLTFPNSEIYAPAP